VLICENASEIGTEEPIANYIGNGKCLKASETSEFLPDFFKQQNNEFGH